MPNCLIVFKCILVLIWQSLSAQPSLHLLNFWYKELYVCVCVFVCDRAWENDISRNVNFTYSSQHNSSYQLHKLPDTYSDSLPSSEITFNWWLIEFSFSWFAHIRKQLGMKRGCWSGEKGVDVGLQLLVYWVGKGYILKTQWWCHRTLDPVMKQVDILINTMYNN